MSRGPDSTAPGWPIPISCRSRPRCFDAVLGERPNQLERQRDDVVSRRGCAALDSRHAGGEITEQGLRTNVSVGIRYLDAWLRGVGAAAIDNLMEDAATAEISRSQVWQWVPPAVHGRAGARGGGRGGGGGRGEGALPGPGTRPRAGRVPHASCVHSARMSVGSTELIKERRCRRRRRRSGHAERRLDGAHQGAEVPALPAPGAGMLSVGSTELIKERRCRRCRRRERAC